MPVRFRPQAPIYMFMMEEYPSPVEGVGLENREAVRAAQGFESLFLRQFYVLTRLYRGVEQLVARWAHNPKVGGSSPPSATNEIKNVSSFLFYIFNNLCFR